MFNSPVELSSLDGTTGFAINGAGVDDFSGLSVSGAGDINGDGINDLIIGAYGADPGGLSYAGTSYVVFGRSTGFDSTLELSSLNGTTGFALNGAAAQDRSGYSLSAAGDINGDGIDDLIIGAFGADPGGAGLTGTSYVVFGKDTGFSSPLELSSLNGTTGFAINGVASNSNSVSGRSVSGAGDINGDGIGDLIIGAPNADPGGLGNAGTSYVVFGKNTSFSPVFELSSLNGATGFALNGVAAFDQSGRSVSGAGDINGDGIGDLVIGADRADPGGLNQAGTSYVVFGKSTGFGPTLELSSLNGTTGFALNGGAAIDSSGISVSGAGDINGDGIGDLIIGAFAATPGGVSFAGTSYVVFGRSTGFDSMLNLTSLNGTTGFAINGAAPNDQSGVSVSGAGDVNGDGIDDLIIGAERADPGGMTQAGTSHVVFGKNTTFSSVFELSSLNGTEGFTLNGAASNDFSGRSVSGAGDINGDGIDDLLIGAPRASPGGVSRAGVSYVVFGRPLTMSNSTTTTSTVATSTTSASTTSASTTSASTTSASTTSASTTSASTTSASATSGVSTSTAGTTTTSGAEATTTVGTTTTGEVSPAFDLKSNMLVSELLNTAGFGFFTSSSVLLDASASALSALTPQFLLS